MARCLLISALQVFPPESGGNRCTAMLAEGLVLNRHEVRIHSLIGRKADVLKGLSSSTQQWEPGIQESMARHRFVWLLAMICYLFFQRENLMEILKKLPVHQKQQMTISAKAKNIRFLKPVKAVAPLAESLRRDLEPERPQKLSS